MFRKKKKQEMPQLSLEEKLEQTEKKLTMELLKLQKHKKETLIGLLDARRHGLVASMKKGNA